MIHTDIRDELVLVGSGFRDHAYTHSSVFLRILSKSGKPLIVHLDCDQTHPQCSEPRLLDEVATQLDWKYFSRYQLMRIFALDRRSVARPDEEEQYHKFAKEIIEGKKEVDPQILLQKRANLSSKMNSAQKRRKGSLSSRKGSAHKSSRDGHSVIDQSEMVDFAKPFHLGEQSDIDSDFEMHQDDKEEEKMPHSTSKLDMGHSILQDEVVLSSNNSPKEKPRSRTPPMMATALPRRSPRLSSGSKKR